jgi:signal transduction histidine kinase
MNNYIETGTFKATASKLPPSYHPKKIALYGILIVFLLLSNSILLAENTPNINVTSHTIDLALGQQPPQGHTSEHSLPVNNIIINRIVLNWESHKIEIACFFLIIFFLIMAIISLIISHKKQLEAEHEAQQLRSERAHLTRVLSMGEIAASLAHELNQPLSAIRTFAQTAQRFLDVKPPQIDEVNKALNGIISGNRHAEEVIKRIRMTMKKEPIKQTPITISEVMSDILILTAHKAKQENVLIKLKIVDDLTRVYGDKTQLQQVLFNLIINAIEAMQDDRIKYYKKDQKQHKITIFSHTIEADYITISVKDNGIGINLDKDHNDNLFEAFYSTKPEGMGMGLSISSSIIKEHGGKIWASVNASKGSTFSFSLPIYKDK